MDENYVAALKRERAAYEQSGKTDRAEQVTAELARVHAAADVPADEAPPVEAKPASKARATTRKRG